MLPITWYIFLLMKEKIFITGASGLLGQALVEHFRKQGFFVYAQYHQNKPADLPGCEWLQGDFSTIESIRSFLKKNAGLFSGCKYLVNNYGPIIYKSIESLTSEDYLTDYFHNVIPAVEIIRFFIEHTHLESVVNIGFEFTGEIKPYRNILSYAAAKNALLLITRSFDARYDHIRFNMVNFPTLEGAEVKAKKGGTISPGSAAVQISKVLLGDA